MNSHYQYTHILFDLDGTVVNSETGVTSGVRYALAKYGIEETDQTKLRRFLGPPLVDSFRKFYGFSHEDAQKLTALYREYYRDIGVHENMLYEGVRELLATLHEEGFLIFLATSKPTDFARIILQDTGVAPYFDLVAGATFDASRHTKEAVLAYALQEGGITDTSRLLMVGDRFHDIEGAHAYGIDVAAVLYGFGNRAEFEAYGAEYIVAWAKELLPICRTPRKLL